MTKYPIAIDVPANVTAQQLYDRAIERGAAKVVRGDPTFLLRYFTALIADCKARKIDVRWMVAQWDDETGWGTSAEWVENGNPGGIAVFPDGTTWGLTFTPELAARAQVTHMARYLGQSDVPADWIATDARWDVPEMLPMVGSVTYVQDLGNGRWATNPNYAKELIERYTAYFGAPQAIPTTGDTTVSTKPYILVTAGHRSDGDAGDPTEKSLTGYMAEEYVKQLRAAGYEADWWQRDLDNDRNPTMTSPGGLDTVALGCGRVLAGRKDAMSVLLDCHYNGPHSPCHVIVPDTVGLGTAYAGGAPADDTAANNVLDVKLATAIGAGIVAATGLTPYKGRLGITNVMSERETGVALQYSARLAMFAATAGSRAKAVRLVVEHGGYQDTPATKDDFTVKCAAAVVKALNEVFGVASNEPSKPVEPPVEVPPVQTPAIAYPEGMDKVVAAAIFGKATGTDKRVYGFDEKGPVSQFWVAEGKRTGQFPALVSVTVIGKAKYFAFSNGLVYWSPEEGKAPLRVMAQAA